MVIVFNSAGYNRLILDNQQFNYKFFAISLSYKCYNMMKNNILLLYVLLICFGLSFDQNFVPKLEQKVTTFDPCRVHQQVCFGGQICCYANCCKRISQHNGILVVLNNTQTGITTSVQFKDPNCKIFSNDSELVCQQCQLGYWSRYGKCTPQNPYCITISKTTGECQSCYPGYSPANYKCVLSDTNGNNSIFCLKTNGSKCSQCVTGYYLDSNSICQRNAYCQIFSTITGECSSCYQGLYFKIGSGCVFSDPQCARFGLTNQDVGYCVDCFIGFSILNGTCRINTTSLGNFRDPNCKTFTNATTSQCRQCYSGYFVKYGNCSQLDPLCKSSNYTTGSCLSCYPGYILVGPKCIVPELNSSGNIDPFCLKLNGSKCQQCAKGYILNSSAICQQVSPLCKTYDNATGNCLSCYLGYALIEGKCSIAELTTVEFRDPNCKIFANSTSSVCKQCNSGFYVVSDRNCTKITCPNNAFYSPSAGACVCNPGYILQNGLCGLLNPLCLTYDSSGLNCVTCLAGLSLVNGTCILKTPNSKQYFSYIYQGVVDVQLSTTQHRYTTFYVQFVQQQDCKNWSQCFNGWVLNYTQKGEDTVIGYPNKALEYPPIFQFSTNSEEDYQIIRQLNLNQVWVQIIEIACQKINPQLVQNSSLNPNLSTSENLNDCYQGYVLVNNICVVKTTDLGCSSFDWATKKCLSCNVGYSIDSNGCTPLNIQKQNPKPPKYFFTQSSTTNTTNTTNTANLTNGSNGRAQLKNGISNISAVLINKFQWKQWNRNIALSRATSSDYIATSQTSLKLDKFTPKTSQHQEQIILDSNKLVKQRLMSYEFLFQSDNLTSGQGLRVPDVGGLILVGLAQSWKGGVSSSVYEPIKNMILRLNQGSTNSNVFKSQDIQRKRINNVNGQAFTPVNTNERVVTQDIETVDPSEIDVFKLYNGDKATVDAAKAYLNITSLSETSASNLLIEKAAKFDNSNSISSVASFGSGQFGSGQFGFGSGQFGSGSRLLQYLTFYQIYNYQKILISQNIFNQPLEVKFNLNCYLIVYVQNQTIQCKGQLISTMFSQVNIITVFDYYKTVSTIWSFSLQIPGQWNFNIYTSFPAPYSFGGMNFYFSVGYKIDISASSQHNFFHPYRVFVNSVVTAQMWTDSRISIRVMPLIQVGPFIKGTIIKLRTDPKITISYYWLWTKRINVRVQWYWQILPYQFQWGFQYRTKKLFGSWNSFHTLVSWPIQKPYSKTLIVDKSWDVCC